MSTKPTLFILASVSILPILSAGCNGGLGGTLGLAPSPGDGGFTIVLSFHRGLTHNQNARQFKQRLEDTVGWKGLFVVQEASHSRLCWGRYRSVRGASRNLRIAKNYRTQNRVPLFAMVVPLPEKDVGPPEWDLKNARGAYSLLVAIFHNDPEKHYYGRKKIAVAYCKQLRDKGFEAYYNHDPSQSHVTIGAFDESAVVRIRAPLGRDVEMGRRVVRNDRLVVRSQRVDDLRAKFPLLAVNGREHLTIASDPISKVPTKVKSKPYLVRIPKLKAAGHAQTLNRLGNAESW